jgi:hypothetical protein
MKKINYPKHFTSEDIKDCEERMKILADKIIASMNDARKLTSPAEYTETHLINGKEYSFTVTKGELFMRTKPEILEDLQVLEASMEHSDNPEYPKIYSCLLEELSEANSQEVREMFLDEVCALEHSIQNWINPDYMVDFEKIRNLVKELRVSSLPF